MPLTRVTITGADNGTDPKELLELWNEFPFVEWGILIGSKTGFRFPGRDWISSLCAAREQTGNLMPLALHVCGGFLREIAAGKSTLEQFLGSQLYAFGRIQLNWHGESQGPQTSENVLGAFCRLDSGFGWDPTIIFQLDGVNDDLFRGAARRFLCCGLFDRSHGAGLIPGEWPQASTEMACGWAGGLGPENLAEELPKISEKAFAVMQFWVDMETKVRSDDDSRLDLEKVRKCLQIAEPFVGGVLTGK